MSEEIVDNKEKKVISFVEYAENMKNIFNEREKAWQKEIIEKLKGMKSTPETLSDTQAELISMRQRITEEINYITKQIAKENSLLKKHKADKFIFYSTGVFPDGTKTTSKMTLRDMNIVSLKKTKGELDIIISGDLCDLEALIDVFIAYHTYLKETVKTLDHSLYGIKNRVELLNLMMGVYK